MTTATTFETLLVAVRGIAAETAAVHAADVDARARFPVETVDALRAAHVLSAPVPRELGGAGCSMMELATCWRCTTSRSPALRAMAWALPSFATTCASWSSGNG
jgi:acyl-CoA dehydrogenase